jgi:hypothetical protein
LLQLYSKTPISRERGKNNFPTWKKQLPSFPPLAVNISQQVEESQVSSPKVCSPSLANLP